MTDNQTPQALLKRFEKAKAKRNQNWWSHMSECYDFAAPQRETFNHHGAGAKKNVDNADSTAVVALETFASRLQSYMVPPWQKWALISLGASVPDEVGEQQVQFEGKEMTVNEALEVTTDIVFEYIHRSNFDTKVFEALLDLGVSTGNMTLEYDAAADELVFNTLPLSQMFLEPGPRGDIDNHWREWDIELGHVERMWPQAKFSDELKKVIAEKPEKKQTFIEGCIYAGKDNYRYVVMHKSKKDLIVDEEMDSTPFISFRSSVVPGETYGRGRVMLVLPAIKTLNMVVEFELKAGAMASSGCWTGVSDGFFNPYNIEVAPGVIIPVQSNDPRNPSLAQLPMDFNFNFTQLKKEELQGEINRALFANPIGSMEDPTKTATEITIRKQMDLQESGGFFSRLFTEFVNKVVSRSVYLLSKEGLIPQIKIDGKDYTIKHTSPLAMAMDLEDVDVVDQVVQRLMSYDPTGALMAAGLKLEDVPAYISSKLGLDPELVRTEAEREEKVTAAKEQMSEQQQIQSGAGPAAQPVSMATQGQ